ncbi:NUDIX hydrolase [Candidatus Halobonum tyrrellensis]|uniref:ADP-ribose pyrophosphatase, Mut/nudix family protein n=1 Tax=Candidatus Halobonum tyrrellensis G22 TaxID=1324957 RepID=V4HDL3_9EURY|nr:NUDIX hydrolase [Candidatus Halobonum tyrrellensis]ESP88790.1 ADP-ribose pyrophosphatase, Mut/nudix family protein [Candidatus Halobonum tyrrellensis G22]
MDDADRDGGGDAPTGTAVDTDGTDADDGGALAWETRESRLDYSCPGFDVRRDAVRFPDGTDGEYHYVDEPPAVVVLPFTPDGSVVCIDEWRQAVGRVNRGIPAGSMESGEDPAEAAARELREETGHEAETLDPLVTVEPSNGVANSVHHHFVARGCTPTADTAFDADESIRPVTVDYATLREAALSGDLRDGRAVLAVSNYEASDG